MPNIIVNPDFTDGMTGWTYSEGVEAVSERDAVDKQAGGRVIMPGARIPGGGYLGQHFGDAILSNAHLYFFCGPLSSRGYSLQVRFDYTDGSTETHKTRAVAELALEEADYEMPLYMRINVPVDTSRHIRKFGITNMDAHKNGTIFVNNFILQGEPVFVAESSHGAAPDQFGRRSLFGSDALTIDRYLSEMDSKLDEILENLKAKRTGKKRKKQKKGKN